MSEFYYCVFCDTIVLSLDQLNEHLIQCLANDENSCEYENSLNETELNFVKNLIEYEKQLNECFQLNPKVLPKNNIKQVLIGCPACDAMIRCFDLIPNRDDKHHCHCGRQSKKLRFFRCIHCNQFSHNECVAKSESLKCFDCSAKDFKISYLKCEPNDEQKRHCYMHLDYYPYVCQFESDEGICGKGLVSIKSCEAHLKVDHKCSRREKEDLVDFLVRYFESKPIPKIDNLINGLDFKFVPQPAIDTNTSPTRAANLSATNNSKTKMGLNTCNVSQTEDQYSDETDERSLRSEQFSDLTDENEFSFHYSSQTIANKYSNNNNKSNSIDKHSISDGYYRTSSQDLNKSLDFIQLPEVPVLKPRGIKRRLKSPKNTLNETISSISANESPDEREVSESNGLLVDCNLTHKRQYLNWFTQTKPTKFPYFPQKDDIVYYIPYGHELYKEEVYRRGLYKQSNKNFTSRYFINDIIVAKVSKIDFLFKQHRTNDTVIRCVYITLRPEDKKYGIIIHVKYHDVEGVVDFVVLKEHYESSVQKEWRIGEEFRSIVDDFYWFGVIVAINSADFCRISSFKKYQIKWYSNGSTEWLSPWDLEPVDKNMVYDRCIAIPVTDLDRKSFFKSSPEEWPGRNELKELRRVANGLRIILNMSESTEFSILDDLTESSYKEKILYPIDLKTLISRVENRYYRSHTSLKYDIKFLESNIRKLIKNVKRDPDYRFDEAIAKRLKYHTKFVTALSLIFIDTHECSNPHELAPNIPDYLETHDVKCYSVKRVHLNLKKKYPALLPTVHKRLPKQSTGMKHWKESFYKAHKQAQVELSLRNSGNQWHRRSINQSNGSTSVKPKAMTSTKSVPHSEQLAVMSRSMSYPIDDELNQSDEQMSGTNDSSDEDNDQPMVDHSSDVCRSEKQWVYESRSDDSDVDPDYKASSYHKNRF